MSVPLKTDPSPRSSGAKDSGTLSLEAIRGNQAGREFFVALCPFRLVPSLLLFDDPDLPPELRSQRALNTARVPEIARYLVENSSSYVLSALSASVDADFSFEVRGDAGSSLGLLTFPSETRMLINDGQHRRAAIETALEERPDMGDEVVPIVLFVDAGLRRSQQMFADLNRHAVKPTRSLGILYDRRDPLARLTCDIASEIDPFRGYTEMEKTSLSNRTRKVFTLSALYQGVQALLSKPKGAALTAEEVALAFRFWRAVGTLMQGWGFVSPTQTSAKLRSAYVHTHAVALQAIGMAGCALVAESPGAWESRLLRLASLDWRREAPRWAGRAILDGRITKAGPSVALTANTLKRELGLELTCEEQQLEKRLGKGAQHVG